MYAFWLYNKNIKGDTMKKFLSIALIFIFSLLVVSCGKTTTELLTTLTEVPSTVTEPTTTLTEVPTTVTKAQTTVTEVPTTVTEAQTTMTESSATTTGDASVGETTYVINYANIEGVVYKDSNSKFIFVVPSGTSPLINCFKFSGMMRNTKSLIKVIQLSKGYKSATEFNEKGTSVIANTVAFSSISTISFVVDGLAPHDDGSLTLYLSNTEFTETGVDGLDAHIGSDANAKIVVVIPKDGALSTTYQFNVPAGYQYIAIANSGQYALYFSSLTIIAKPQA